MGWPEYLNRGVRAPGCDALLFVTMNALRRSCTDESVKTSLGRLLDGI